MQQPPYLHECAILAQGCCVMLLHTSVEKCCEFGGLEGPLKPLEEERVSLNWCPRDSLQ